MTPSITIETITPEMAAQYLQLNIGNRNTRPTVVQQYANDMASGNWVLTGEAIIFNGSKLVNGQHRLEGCVSADVPFTTVVVRGVGDDAFTVMDSGLKRTTGDMLGHVGVANRNAVAAAARTVLVLRCGVHPGNRAAVMGASSRHSILAEVQAHQDLYGWAVLLSKTTPLFKGSQLAGLITHLAQIGFDRADIQEFVGGIATGEDLSAGDPRLALRNWRANRSGTGLSTRADVELAVLIRGWNAWTSGRDIHHLKVPRKSEAFPSVNGSSVGTEGGTVDAVLNRLAVATARLAMSRSDAGESKTTKTTKKAGD